MGRPLRTAKAVESTSKIGVIGAENRAGQQIQMIGFVTGGSANNSTIVVQKGTHRFRLTTSDGTETLTLRPLASGSLSAGECSLTATDSAAGTYFVSRVGPNWIEIGATGTYAIGDVNQPGRFQIVTA